MEAGAAVGEGEPLAVVEAMKMEHTGAGGGAGQGQGRAGQAGRAAPCSAWGSRLFCRSGQEAGRWGKATDDAAVALMTGKGKKNGRPIRAPTPQRPPRPCPLIPPAVRAPCAGTVAELHAFVGAQVGGWLD